MEGVVAASGTIKFLKSVYNCGYTLRVEFKVEVGSLESETALLEAKEKIISEIKNLVAMTVDFMGADKKMVFVDEEKSLSAGVFENNLNISPSKSFSVTFSFPVPDVNANVSVNEVKPDALLSENAAGKAIPNESDVLHDVSLFAKGGNSISNDLSPLAALLERLEICKEKYGITSVHLNTASLEDVFMRVAEGSAFMHAGTDITETTDSKKRNIFNDSVSADDDETSESSAGDDDRRNNANREGIHQEDNSSSESDHYDMENHDQYDDQERTNLVNTTKESGRRINSIYSNNNNNNNTGKQAISLFKLSGRHYTKQAISLFKFRLQSMISNPGDSVFALIAGSVVLVLTTCFWIRILYQIVMRGFLLLKKLIFEELLGAILREKKGYLISAAFEANKNDRPPPTMEGIPVVKNYWFWTDPPNNPLASDDDLLYQKMTLPLLEYIFSLVLLGIILWRSVFAITIPNSAVEKFKAEKSSGLYHHLVINSCSSATYIFVYLFWFFVFVIPLIVICSFLSLFVPLLCDYADFVSFKLIVFFILLSFVLALHRFWSTEENPWANPASGFLGNCCGSLASTRVFVKLQTWIFIWLLFVILYVTRRNIAIDRMKINEKKHVNLFNSTPFFDLYLDVGGHDLNAKGIQF